MAKKTKATKQTKLDKYLAKYGWLWEDNSPLKQAIKPQATR